jgi:hypothetical protein
MVASVAAALASVVWLAPTAAGAKPTDSGEAAKAPQTIVADALQATGQVSSVRIVGTITTSTQTVSLNIVSAHGAGGGTMSLNGATFGIIVAPPNVYLKSDAASWTKVTSNKLAGQLFADKWLQTTTADKNYGGLTNLFDVSTLMQTSSTDGPITKGRVTSYRGTKAVPLKDATKGSVVYVAATGKPYVLGIVGTGKNHGEVVLSHFGTAKVPSAPRRSIDLSQLEQQAGSGSKSSS